MRQMPEVTGRQEREAGEARHGSRFDEAEHSPRPTNDTGPNLNLSNRPVRTRMPGGVAGGRSAMIASYADWALHVKLWARGAETAQAQFEKSFCFFFSKKKPFP